MVRLREVSRNISEDYAVPFAAIVANSKGEQTTKVPKDQATVVDSVRWHADPQVWTGKVQQKGTQQQQVGTIHDHL
ncbi:hypothetical protein BDA96_04G205700 [Sorghum bicolor]|jgi:hypothetical protein|uniref:Uncharacterized protein n=2 Tax=Sorghum bicolor TaxID=4558 RepID=A0A921UIN9_SORBI|nr:hypothetical protein BDA96_04G205700 [Sorghum bicolor]OQU85217.1 hypothetical protein SORBI_3004G193350 [Sorghum bicolor]